MVFHSPDGFPSVKGVKVFLEYLTVRFVVNLSVDDAIIRKQAFFRLDVLWQVINRNRKRSGHLGTPLTTVGRLTLDEDLLRLA